MLSVCSTVCSLILQKQEEAKGNYKSGAFCAPSFSDYIIETNTFSKLRAKLRAILLKKNESVKRILHSLGTSVSLTHKFLHIQQQNPAKVQKSAKERSIIQSKSAK